MSLKVNEPSFTDELMSLKIIVRDKFASQYSVACAWEQLKRIKKETVPGVVPGSLMFAVGYHHNLPVEVMWEIAHYGDDDACEGLASNPNVPIEIMVFLRTSGTEWVRQAVVGNARCPVELVGEFTSDSLVVKSLVASKKDVPLEVLEQFVGEALSWSGPESFVAVVGAIACNPITPPKLGVVAWKQLVKLSANDYVVNSWGQDLPSALLVEVLKDEFPEVHEGMPREWLLNLFGIVHL